MSASRSSLITGVGRIVRGSYSSAAETKFKLIITETHADVKINDQTIGKRWIGSIAELSFTPDGRVTADGLTLFWNQFANMLPGASIMTSSDVPTVIHCSDGAKITINASNITRMPGISLHPEKPFIGEATITGIIDSGADFSTGTTFVQVSASSTYADSGFTSAGIIRQQYTAALGAVSGFTSFEAKDGWMLDFNLDARPLIVQGVVRDYRFGGVSLSLKATGGVVGPTTAQLFAAQLLVGSGANPGREEAANGAQLTITGADSIVYVTVPKASIVRSELNFSAEDLRTGDTEFFASRTYSTGVQAALYTIANS